MANREYCRVTRRRVYCKEDVQSSKKKSRLIFNDLYDANSNPTDINNIINNIISNNITELHIDGILKIDDSILNSLKNNKSLKSLIITNTKFATDDIEKIGFFLSNNISLSKLIVDSPIIEPRYQKCTYFFNYLISIIVTNKEIPLKYVSFSNCNDKFFASSAWEREQLSLFDIGLLMTQKKGLYTLKLQNIGLEDYNIVDFRKGIADSVEELDISNNEDISDEGGMIIVRALKENMGNNKLRKINVNGTNISEKVKEELEKYIIVEKPKSLKWKFMKELMNKEEVYGYKY